MLQKCKIKAASKEGSRGLVSTPLPEMLSKVENIFLKQKKNLTPYLNVSLDTALYEIESFAYFYSYSPFYHMLWIYDI